MDVLRAEVDLLQRRLDVYNHCKALKETQEENTGMPIDLAWLEARLKTLGKGLNVKRLERETARRNRSDFIETEVGRPDSYWFIKQVSSLESLNRYDKAKISEI